MPKRLYTDKAIMECLEQWGTPMTAQEITNLTGRNPGTISGRLSQMVSQGTVQIANLGHMPRLYIKAPPGWTPPTRPVVEVEAVGTAVHQQIEQIVEPWRVDSPVPDSELGYDDGDDAPDFTDLPVTKFDWEVVVDLWRDVFNVYVSPEDAELMVKLANRHVG